MHQKTPAHTTSASSATSILDSQKLSRETHPLHPAYLFLGPHALLVATTVHFLQKQFCCAGGCGTCIPCTQIQTQQHHGVIWLTPAKQYTLEELEPIFSTIIFALAPEEHFFFVIQKADFLTTICANKLLKSMEEPPAGYHFILLAQRQDAILPTIRSRCMSTAYNSDRTSDDHAQLFSLFTSTLPGDPAAFLKLLDQAALNERESVELLDRLLKFWLKKSNQLFIEKKNTCAISSKNFSAITAAKIDPAYVQAHHVIEILQQATVTPPMPGSSKLFWKNLYIQIKQ